MLDLQQASAMGTDPLYRWADTIEELTKLRRSKQVRKVYIELLNCLNSREFDGKLVSEENSTLIVPPRPASRLSDAATDNNNSNDFNEMQLQNCSRNMHLLVTE